MCKTDKENYEKYWDDISPFIKYGCLKDTKFCDKMNDYILFKNLDDKYLTLPELLVKKEVKEESALMQTATRYPMPMPKIQKTLRKKKTTARSSTT